jgi:hypothetical protein
MKIRDELEDPGVLRILLEGGGGPVGEGVRKGDLPAKVAPDTDPSRKKWIDREGLSGVQSTRKGDFEIPSSS